MIAFDRWQATKLSVASLFLDPFNPRIPSSGEGLTQDELMEDLVRNDRVLDLAKSIAANGYFPIEALIIVKEDGERYVIEGNRRVAALKLLLKPEDAPEGWEKRFSKLANSVSPETIRSVKVVVAPNRGAATPVVRSRHTRPLLEKWSPLMQAKSYFNLVAKEEQDISSIAREHNIPASEVAEALQMYRMYQVILKLDLPEDVARKVHNPRQFPMTTVERLYKAPEVNQLLGISFDEKGELQGSVDPNEFRRALARIVSDIAHKNVGSRDLNTTADMLAHLKKLGADMPDLTKKGNFTFDSLLAEPRAKPREKPESKPAQKKPRAPRQPRALIPSSVICTAKNRRVKDLVGELKDGVLQVSRFPNAVALMFRSLLEMSLSYHLRKTGHLEAMRQKETERLAKKTRRQKLPGDYPKLKQMLDYVGSEATGILQDPKLRKSIRKLAGERDTLITLDSLHAFVHSEQFYPTEEILRRFWNQVADLFEIILAEPTGQKQT